MLDPVRYLSFRKATPRLAAMLSACLCLISCEPAADALVVGPISASGVDDAADRLSMLPAADTEVLVFHPLCVSEISTRMTFIEQTPTRTYGGDFELQRTGNFLLSPTRSQTLFRLTRPDWDRWDQVRAASTALRAGRISDASTGGFSIYFDGADIDIESCVEGENRATILLRNRVTDERILSMQIDSNSFEALMLTQSALEGAAR